MHKEKQKIANLFALFRLAESKGNNEERQSEAAAIALYYSWIVLGLFFVDDERTSCFLRASSRFLSLVSLLFLPTSLHTSFSTSHRLRSRRGNSSGRALQESVPDLRSQVGDRPGRVRQEDSISRGRRRHLLECIEVLVRHH